MSCFGKNSTVFLVSVFENFQKTVLLLGKNSTYTYKIKKVNGKFPILYVTFHTKGRKYYNGCVAVKNVKFQSSVSMIYKNKSMNLKLRLNINDYLEEQQDEEIEIDIYVAKR